MLVLSPTRELAAQIAENMRGYAKFTNLSVECIFGGVPVGSIIDNRAGYPEYGRELELNRLPRLTRARTLI